MVRSKAGRRKTQSAPTRLISTRLLVKGLPMLIVVTILAMLFSISETKEVNPNISEVTLENNHMNSNIGGKTNKSISHKLAASSNKAGKSHVSQTYIDENKLYSNISTVRESEILKVGDADKVYYRELLEQISKADPDLNVRYSANI